MIPVSPQPEPSNFNARVRARGIAFLKSHVSPTTQQWRTHSYWCEALDQLHTAYRGICAYSCHWINHDTGAKTVEHFRPKSKHPKLAYEWSNYRLVAGLLNGRKGDREDVLDPFKVEPGWFVIEFPSLLVKPGNGLTASRRRQVLKTIDCLGLNDEDTCIKSRTRYVETYCEFGDIGYLERDAPFLASELKRQRLLVKIKTMMVFPRTSGT